MAVNGQELTGTQIRGGILSYGARGVGVSLPAQPRTTLLPGSLTYKQIREYRNEPTVKLARTFVVAPALIAGWSVDFDEDVPENIVQFISNEMLPQHDHLMRTGLWGLIDWGWQPYEKVFGLKKDATGAMRWGINKLKPLLQDMTSILINPDTGGFVGLQNGPLNTSLKTLDASDVLVLYQNVEGTNWYGESDMLAIHLLMEKYTKIEHAADRYDQKVAGAHWIVYFPVGTSPFGSAGTETDNFLIAQALLNSLESNGSICVPNIVNNYVQDLNQIGKDQQAWRIELMSADGGTSNDMIARMQYLDTLKIRAFGLPERSITEGKYGTKAEAEEHGDFATVSINLRRKDITRECNWHVVNQLLAINFGEQYVNKVRLIPNPINDEALQRNAEIFKRVLNNPSFGPAWMSRIDVGYIADQLEIPLKPEGTNPSVPTAPVPAVPAKVT